MDDHLPAELAPALADLTHATKDAHEQASQDERAQAFDVLGDVLTAGGYAAWRRDQGEHSDEG